MQPLKDSDPENMDEFDLEYSQAPQGGRYEFGMVISCYNRPRYLRKTLATLRRSSLENTVIIIVDDGSDSTDTLRRIRDFDLPNTPIIKAFRKNKTDCLIHENLKFGWDFLLSRFQCTYLTNLDSDAIVLPHWLNQLKSLHELPKLKSERLLVTGFNAYQHKIHIEKDHYYEKKRVGGINLFFSASIYKEDIRPSLVNLYWDQRVVNIFEQEGYKIVCTKPSVIQHIGKEGLWSDATKGSFDFAIDYGNASSLAKLFRLLFYRGRRKVFFLIGSVLRKGTIDGPRLPTPDTSTKNRES